MVGLCLLATLILLPGVTLGRNRFTVQVPHNPVKNLEDPPIAVNILAPPKLTDPDLRGTGQALDGGTESRTSVGSVRQDVASGAESKDAPIAADAESIEDTDVHEADAAWRGDGADTAAVFAPITSEGRNAARPVAQEPGKGTDETGNVARDSKAEGNPLALSAVVLFHNEYNTLNHTLETWEQNELYRYVSEIIFFLNGVPSEEEFIGKIPRLGNLPWAGIIRIISSEENLKLGLAITSMVEFAKEENVLLLEKDWALIEPPSEVETMLRSAKRLLKEGEANVIRFRHRDRPGAPLHARIMHEGREQQMLQQQKNLYCYLHHWIKDLPGEYPEYFHRCSNRTEDAVTWCAKAKYCQWTNNPAMFQRQWFLDELGQKYREVYQKTVQQDANSAMLDFEFYTNWQHDVWNDRDFTVALPKGLFEHQEVGEQNLMNTVWYAWNRLHTDAEEKKRTLLASEVSDCSVADKKMDSGPKWVVKFPIDFVRMYHYDKAMSRKLEDAVDELGAEALRSRETLENGHGTWRHGVTALTNLWYKTCLFKYPEEPEEMDITFVTALYVEDDELTDRELEGYAANLGVISDYRIVIFCTDKTKNRLNAILTDNLGWEEEMLTNLHYITQPIGKALETLLGTENMERVERLQASETWREKAKERGSTIPSAMALMLNMVKPYMVQTAMNDTIGTHFVWVDCLSPCLAMMKAANMTLTVGNDTVFRAHLLLSAMVTGVRARSREEIESALGASGFSTDMLLEHMQIRESIVSGVSIADLQVIGGSRLAVTLMVGYYDVVLRDLLRNDALGTGREALSIAHKNVNYNFEFFDSRESCRRGDSCEIAALDKEYSVNRIKGCALFRWASGCVSNNR